MLHFVKERIALSISMLDFSDVNGLICIYSICLNKIQFLGLGFKIKYFFVKM